MVCLQLLLDIYCITNVDCGHYTGIAIALATGLDIYVQVSHR